jgi:hypothetical protein
MGYTVFRARRIGGQRPHLRCFLFILALTVLGSSLLAPPPASAQELFVDPTLSTPVDLVFTVDIAIDCAGLSVKGVESILAFDPFLLRLDAVTPGPWYTGTGRDYYFFDYTAIEPQGTIHFASSVLSGANDQSLTIAVCHFTVLGFGSTPVIFQDVDVRDPDNLDLGFGHSIGDLILIDPAIPVVLSSFGGVKALYR